MIHKLCPKCKRHSECMALGACPHCGYTPKYRSIWRTFDVFAMVCVLALLYFALR